MGLYRKKPVVIEAVRFGGSTTHRIAVEHWMETGEYIAPGMVTRDITTVTIPTLEGDMTAQSGDWIIRGVQGEFYPIKDSIFRDTYEAVDGEGDSDD